VVEATCVIGGFSASLVSEGRTIRSDPAEGKVLIEREID